MAARPLPPGSLAGKIVLVDRGNCNFTLKVKNVGDAGGLIGIIGLIAPEIHSKAAMAAIARSTSPATWSARPLPIGYGAGCQTPLFDSIRLLASHWPAPWWAAPRAARSMRARP